MRIASIAHAVPSDEVTNEDILGLLRRRNALQFEGSQGAQFQQRVEDFLHSTGSEVRRWRTADEKSGDLLLSAARRSLEASDLDPGEIQLVIYVGVGRAWIEPAMAGFVQDKLGLNNATGFDILEACASWLRGLQVARQFMQGGSYHNALIVNCECNAREFLQFEFADADELDLILAGFTVGEAATATVLVAEPIEDDFFFDFTTLGRHVPLCMIPLDASEYLDESPTPRGRPGKFFSHSGPLIRVGMQELVRRFAEVEELAAYDYDVVIPHSAGSKPTRLSASRLGFPQEAVVDIFPRFGNTASASAPLAMSVAAQEGRLRRGHRVLALAPSAGFSLALARFTF